MLLEEKHVSGNPIYYSLMSNKFDINFFKILTCQLNVGLWSLTCEPLISTYR